MNEKQFDNTQRTFPGILQQNGYQTAWIGKMHLGTLPGDFDYFNILPGQGKYYNPDFIAAPNDTVRMNGYVTNIITDLSVSWLNRRDTTRPFMLIVGEKATSHIMCRHISGSVRNVTNLYGFMARQIIGSYMICRKIRRNYRISMGRNLRCGI